MVSEIIFLFSPLRKLKSNKVAAAAVAMVLAVVMVVVVVQG
jgi:hypothetical protein